MSYDLKFLRRYQSRSAQAACDAARCGQSYDEPSPPRAERRALATRGDPLGIIGERGGCVVFTRIAVMYGLRKGVQDAPPEFDPERQRDRPWGKRKLKGDE